MKMKAARTLLDSTKLQLNDGLSRANTIIQNIVVVIFTTSVICFCAAFLYGTFYFYYVPVVSQEKPVFFQFRVCENGAGMCSFPTANISLTKDGQNEVFKLGQSYRIVLEMDVPETDVNRHIGMFMIELQLYNQTGYIVQTSARASSLHYKSELLRMLETFMFGPLYLFGYIEQKQLLHVDLLPDFTDNIYNPSVGLVIEVHSMKVELYSAKLKIFAQFSGIRYFLYYWPVTSAIIGFSINFFILSCLTLLSWYQFWLPGKPGSRGFPTVRVYMPENRRSGSPRTSATAGPSSAEAMPETLCGRPSHRDDDDDSDDKTDDEDTCLLSRDSSRPDSGLRLRQAQTFED